MPSENRPVNGMGRYCVSVNYSNKIEFSFGANYAGFLLRQSPTFYLCHTQ